MANRIVTRYLQGGLDDLFNGEEGTLNSCTYQPITWLEETPSKNTKLTSPTVLSLVNKDCLFDTFRDGRQFEH